MRARRIFNASVLTALDSASMTTKRLTFDGPVGIDGPLPINLQFYSDVALQALIGSAITGWEQIDDFNIDVTIDPGANTEGAAWGGVEPGLLHAGTSYGFG
jgi:hypothetical protein